MTRLLLFRVLPWSHVKTLDKMHPKKKDFGLGCVSRQSEWKGSKEEPGDLGNDQRNGEQRYMKEGGSAERER